MDSCHRCARHDGVDRVFEECIEAGNRAKDVFHFRRASELYQKAIGQEVKPSTGNSLLAKMMTTVHLATCLRELANYREAEKVLTGCLENIDGHISGSGVTSEKQMYARALTALATLYQAQSKYAAAIKLHEKSVALTRDIDHERPSDTLCLAENIAGYAEALRKSGDLLRAETYHREALDIRTRALEQRACTELELAVSYTQLGCTFSDMANYDEAYNYHHLALKLRYKYLDFSHGLISESMNYCAESLCGLRRGVEGIPLAFHSVKARKRVFGESHPAYAHALSVLASCYYSVGRSLDAQHCIETCVKICENVFHENHANLVPNLLLWGDILLSIGDFEQAKNVYRRSAAIHQANFNEGQQVSRLEKCLAGIAKAEQGLSFRYTFQQKHSMKASLTRLNFQFEGTPVIMFTDIGRDVDDEMALVLLSSLRRMRMLNPIAVIATLSPEQDRAYLARGSMDILAMADVPVGIGSSGGIKSGLKLEVYDAEYSLASPDIHASGMDLVYEALVSAPHKSVQLLCLASLTDVATLIREKQELFTSKVKEVAFMGGVMPIDDGETLSPDSAYNNNCDIVSAEFVYEKCQELRVPTATLTRWAAYGCPCRPLLMDQLARIDHMTAVNIQAVMKQGVDSLWTKVILPSHDPRREKLPPRCDVKWFYKVFLGHEGDPEEFSASIWRKVKTLNMYDPLAVMMCVPSYRSLYFNYKTKIVHGVEHIVIGESEVENGVVDEASLFNEYSRLFSLAFQNSLHKEKLSALRMSQISLS
ncbi:hypothetical protein HJC23_011587 [Cyclotella cryptica]|uniref:Inosine/uridine-preferring nucleoside hydrolase domain-containing protein n=1 Tax=Cyclotella cryptica TaxID=29204 RepID=A0ABD3QSJ1_9STRA|eukprot:CCRYP_002708-RA/>CCRYP_002708-RA protein AED:0.01 eAED:0.01 QI:0/-1/0/1/-1/1/1/0/765